MKQTPASTDEPIVLEQCCHQCCSAQCRASTETKRELKGISSDMSASFLAMILLYFSSAAIIVVALCVYTGPGAALHQCV